MLKHLVSYHFNWIISLFRISFTTSGLLYTDVANAAFFTIFYVPMVPIIIFLFKKQSIHWSVWPSVFYVLLEVIY